MMFLKCCLRCSHVSVALMSSLLCALLCLGSGFDSLAGSQQYCLVPHLCVVVSKQRLALTHCKDNFEEQ